jgi:hypothetical protein
LSRLTSSEIFFLKPFGSSEEEERREKKERREKDVVMEILLDVVMEKNSLEEKPCRHRSVTGPRGMGFSSSNGRWHL